MVDVQRFPTIRHFVVSYEGGGTSHVGRKVLATLLVAAGSLGLALAAGCGSSSSKPSNNKEEDAGPSSAGGSSGGASSSGGGSSSGEATSSGGGSSSGDASSSGDGPSSSSGLPSLEASVMCPMASCSRGEICCVTVMGLIPAIACQTGPCPALPPPFIPTPDR